MGCEKNDAPPKPRFFNIYDIRDPKATFSPNLKVLAQIIKNFIFFTIVDPL